jgi:tetratricopeptide (TPR) repeat protein
MTRREGAQTVRRHGGVVVDKPDPTVHMVVLGEEDLPLLQGADLEDPFDPATREAIERGAIEVLTETRLWERLGLIGPQGELHRLYTPAMLAELLGVSVAVIRRWHRRGLIVPVHEVQRLPYFDFQEVATARRLAELLAAGMSPQRIERQLAALARWMPGAKRRLAQLSVMVQGREILLRQGDGLIEPGGQLRFDFDAAEEAAARPPDQAGPPDPRVASALALADPRHTPGPLASVEDLARAAGVLEEAGHLKEAVEMHRAAMAAGGATPEGCFQIAELLYRLGDLGGARERYYMALELDEDFVEARSNLGCVLAELGQRELAMAAFEGALAYHPDYADAHYHLARTLDELGRSAEAASHWRAFLDLAPEGPWADQARARLRT